MNMKYFVLNILKTKCNSVQEREFLTVSRTLLCVVFKIFKKKNFTFIKRSFLNNLRLFTNKCTHLLKTSNCRPQGPQNAALQQRFLHVSPNNPISAEKLKITFAQIQILLQKTFPEWFGPKQIEDIRFQNRFQDKSAQTDCSK